MSGNPYYNQTSLLLHCNGTNGSTTFTDNSPIGRTITANGNAQISTAQSKFNGSSALFDGTGDYLTTTYTTATMDWWVGPFTISCWVYAASFSEWSYTSTVQVPVLVGNADNASATNYWSFGPESAGHLAFHYYNGAAVDKISTATIGTSGWHHIAMTVDAASRIKLWVDGVGSSSTVISGTPQSSSGTPLTIGRISNTDLNGYIAELEVLYGICAYTANFTPPAAPPGDSQLGFSGNITESLAVTNWRVSAVNSLTGAGADSLTNAGAWTTTTGEAGTTYLLPVTTFSPCDLLLSPKIDMIWTATTAVTLNSYCVPTSPDTTPKLYKATSIGSSPNKTGATEPTWPSSGTVADGDITWTFVSDLPDRPLSLGTKIPS
jgi:hypothetical protein